jgi:hypothetical protein
MLLHKKLYLEMDNKAVQIVGKESLITSLTKLASIDQSMTTGKTGFFRPASKKESSISQTYINNRIRLKKH